eukprot:gb/GFBE01014794.1/.p1 GENE.gb/GFBE01014794.1/~~gb/GFBE01014794.1/.p1  ORF type:complete len:497 (+),score=77.73 gb/GFBE01014794.1/:1-1491(+)
MGPEVAVHHNESAIEEFRKGSGHVHANKWWDEHYEYDHFQACVVIALVLLTLLFDLSLHKLRDLSEASFDLSQLEPHGKQHHKDKHAKKEKLRKEMRAHHPDHQTLWKELVSKATGEFTVLGFLACLLWVFKEADGFAMIYDAFEDSDFALPDSDHAYLEGVEAIHMALFVAMLSYVSGLACTIVVARWTMRQWLACDTAIKKGFKDKTVIRGKEYEWAQQQPRFLRHFARMRTHFLTGLEGWKGRWDIYDEELDTVVQDVGSSCLSEFLCPWFPLAEYLAMNYRYVMEDMIEIKEQTWIFIILTFGVHAAVHRAGIDFSFKLFWGLVLSTAMGLVWIWTTWRLYALERGRHFYYNQNNLCAHRCKLSLWAARLVQVSSFSLNFYLASGMASRTAWKFDYDEAVASTVLLVLGIPAFGALTGYVLGALVLTNSCGSFITEKNILRIAVIIENWKAREGDAGAGGGGDFVPEDNLGQETRNDELAKKRQPPSPTVVL